MEHRKPARVTTWLSAVVLSFFVAPWAASEPATADGLDPSYNVWLWATKSFSGEGGERFRGTAFFYQAVNEGNPSLDFYFVGLKFQYQNPIGVFAHYNAWTEIWNLDGLNVWDIEGEPWYKDPELFDRDVTVGSEATVTVHLENDGYDRGYWHDPGVIYYMQYEWYHSFTRADSDTWVSKSGAMVVQVEEVGGNSRVLGKVRDIYYVWFGWDWGCWCDLYRYRHAEFPNGDWTEFQDQTPGS